MRFLFKVKILLLTGSVLLFTCRGNAFAELRIGSWNLARLGEGKNDTAIRVMAQAIRQLDLVAFQEINTRSGAKALARLVGALNREGAAWDYCISGPTSAATPGASERYAFVWKKSKIRLRGKAFLSPAYGDVISREPYIGVFRAGRLTFTLINIHAVPKKKQPERELKYLRYLPDSLGLHLPVFLGDFNCPETHTVFNPLKKKGFVPALRGQKTTLRQQCLAGDCLASAYDNIFYPGQWRLLKAGIVPFYERYREDMRRARKVSDHVPVYAILEEM